MKTVAFIERARMGKSFYQLSDDHLRVSGTRFLMPYTREIDLREVSPRVERLNRRLYRLIAFCLSMGVLMTLLTVLLMVQKLPPFGIYFFARYTGIAAAIFLGTGIIWIPRVEVVRFKSTLGATLFDVVKEKKYAAEFEEFVECLRARVLESKELGKSNSETGPSAAALLKPAPAANPDTPPTPC